MRALQFSPHHLSRKGEVYTTLSTGKVILVSTKITVESREKQFDTGLESDDKAQVMAVLREHNDALIEVVPKGGK